MDCANGLDRAGNAGKCLLVVGDNSFYNRALFTAALQRTAVIARARHDVKLCKRALGGSRRFYDSTRLTPEQVRQDESIGWKKRVSFLETSGVTCVTKRSGAFTDGRVAVDHCYDCSSLPPFFTKFRAVAGKAIAILTHDSHGTAREFLQAYADRWQIEVNHREEKDTLGVGQAQLRSLRSVPRQPIFVVAAYSAFLLAGLLAQGKRT